MGRGGSIAKIDKVPGTTVQKTRGTLAFFKRRAWELIVTLGKYNCLRLA